MQPSPESMDYLYVTNTSAETFALWSKAYLIWFARVSGKLFVDRYHAVWIYCICTSAISCPTSCSKWIQDTVLRWPLPTNASGPILAKASLPFAGCAFCGLAHVLTLIQLILRRPAQPLFCISFWEISSNRLIKIGNMWWNHKNKMKQVKCFYFLGFFNVNWNVFYI